MAEIIKGKNEIVELYNANEMAFGRVEFLKDGFVINTDNTPLHNKTIHGLEPRRWHIYTVENHEIVGLCGLSNNNLEKLKKFMEEIKEID